MGLKSSRSVDRENRTRVHPDHGAPEVYAQGEGQALLLVEASPDSILVVDADGRILIANRAACLFYGYGTKHEMRGKSFLDHVPADSRTRVQDVIRRIFVEDTSARIEHGVRRVDGTATTVDAHGTSILDRDGNRAVMLVLRDITDYRQHEEQLRHLAYYDPVTNLLNGSALHERMAELVSAGDPWTLLLLDLTHFKEVNDTFGHQYGDRLLERIGQRLRILLREGDFLYRVGGDEFAIILPAASLQAALSAARKLEAAIRVPVTLDGIRLAVGASIGIARCPEEGADGTTLLRQAAVALQAAKRAATYVAVYDPNHDPYRPERLALVGDLRDAIKHNHLSLHFQPKVHLRGGGMQVVEALARWEHPTRGSIPPAEFIPLAEETGLIDSLTHWVIHSALRQCKEWHTMGRELTVAINLSARNLRDADLVDTVAHALSVTHLSPDALEVEITESLLMDDPEGALRILSRLRAMGMRISIDDFGTGYSSLGYLQRLPVDSVKIDRTFVAEMARNQSDAAIVRAVIDLAHTLHLGVIAEGVEDRQTWDLLEAEGCDMAQGYFITRPLAAPAFQDWLQAHPSLPGRA